YMKQHPLCTRGAWLTRLAPETPSAAATTWPSTASFLHARASFGELRPPRLPWKRPPASRSLQIQRAWSGASNRSFATTVSHAWISETPVQETLNMLGPEPGSASEAFLCAEPCLHSPAL